jgi:hypothetical protein
MTSVLHDRLEEASRDIVPRRDLLARARVDGQRRLRRRHLSIGVSVAVAVGLIALSADTVRAWNPAAPSYAMDGPLGDGKVHGNLAGDVRYADAVRSTVVAWLATASPSKYGHALGSPRVIWAGTTPAGPAAVVEQSVQVGGRRKTGLWFIGTGAAGPRVASDNLDHPRIQAWYVDLDHRVLAIVDDHTDRAVAFRWNYTPDGQARHAFERLSFDDGMAVVAVPAGVSRDTVVVGDLPFSSPEQMVGIGNVELDTSPTRTGLAWVNPQSRAETLIPFIHTSDHPRLEAPPFPVTQALFQRAGRAFEANTDDGTGMTQWPTWYVYGETPRGHHVIVFQRQIETDPARLYALVDSTLSDLGPVDRTAPLPVRLHLPDGEGWVVASYGCALEYRLGNGAWIAAGPDAALVPEDATSVAVVSANGDHVDVSLASR